MKLVLHFRLQTISLLNIYTLCGCRAITTEKAGLLYWAPWFGDIVGRSLTQRFLSCHLYMEWRRVQSNSCSHSLLAYIHSPTDAENLPETCSWYHWTFLMFCAQKLPVNIFSNICAYTAIREQLEVLLNKLNWQLFTVPMGNQCVLQ